MNFNFDQTLDHRYDHSYRWAQPEGRDDIIGMGTADMDYECASAIRDAVEHVARENTYNYRMKTDLYYENLIRFYKDWFNTEIRKEWLFNIPGTLAAIRMLFGAFSHAGDYIITQSPYFDVFHMMITESGRRMLLNPMKLVNGRYELDFEDFEEKIRKYHPSIFLLINPQNPTGRVFTTEELNRLVAICAENQVLIISDEVHGFVTFDGHNHIPILALSEKAREISFLVVSFSKGYNLMSLPHALTMCANPILQARWLQYAFPFDFQYATNSFALAAVTAATSREGQYWLTAVNQYLKTNRDLLCDRLENSGLPIHPVKPEGSFVLWADCREMDTDLDHIDSIFMDQAGIALNNGLDHGPDGRGFIRINFALTRKNLEIAADRIDRISIS